MHFLTTGAKPHADLVRRRYQLSLRTNTIMSEWLVSPALASTGSLVNFAKQETSWSLTRRGQELLGQELLCLTEPRFEF